MHIAGAPPPGAAAQLLAGAVTSCVPGTWGCREVSAGDGQGWALGRRAAGAGRVRGGAHKPAVGRRARLARAYPAPRRARAPRGPSRRPEAGVGLGRSFGTRSAGLWGSARARRLRAPWATGHQMRRHDDWAEV